MKALSIHQPWASLIIHGPKRIENRSWPTPHRGTILIHATRRQYQGEDVPGQSGPMVYGSLLGTVDLVDCVPLKYVADRPFAEGPWCWLLENPRPLKIPIPYRGRQQLWNVPDEVVREPAQLLPRRRRHKSPRALGGRGSRPNRLPAQ
jgi:hypothetical protein